MANLREPNLGIIMNGHELEKITSELIKVSKDEGEKEIEDLANRLSEALEDALSILQNPGDGENQARVLEKYKHNIPSVLKETEEYDEANK